MNSHSLNSLASYFVFLGCRKLASTTSMDSNSLKCAIDHILEAQQKGEINEDNVLYIVENINVAGRLTSHFINFFIDVTQPHFGSFYELFPLDKSPFILD